MVYRLGSQQPHSRSFSGFVSVFNPKFLHTLFDENANKCNGYTVTWRIKNLEKNLPGIEFYSGSPSL